MVALRLTRKGTKNRPYYKIVAIDHRKRRDGRYIEQLGTYDPLQEGVNYAVDLEKIDKWISVGAKPSVTVASIIRKARGGEAPAKAEAAKPAPTPVPAEEPKAEAPAEEVVETPAPEAAVEETPEASQSETAPAEESSEDEEKA